MAKRNGQTSPLVYARIAGLLYLIIILAGIFAEFLVRSSLIVPDDAAATAANIEASLQLFRLGFIADLVMIASDVALAVMLYVLLRPVSATLSALAAFFRLAQAATLSLNLLNQFIVTLLLGKSGYLSAFDQEQLQALALLFLNAHKYGYYIALVFFAFACLALGHLMLRSGFLPRILGVLLVIAFFSYLGGSVGAFLLPEYEPLIANSPFYVGPAVIAELSVCLWLLIRGVDAEAWRRRWQEARA